MFRARRDRPTVGSAERKLWEKEGRESDTDFCCHGTVGAGNGCLPVRSFFLYDTLKHLPKCVYLDNNINIDISTTTTSKEIVVIQHSDEMGLFVFFRNITTYPSYAINGHVNCIK